MPRIGLVQRVAPRQCCLHLSNVQSCYATMEYRQRNICSNKFGIYSQPLFQTFGFSAHFPRLHCSNLLPPVESCVKDAYTLFAYANLRACCAIVLENKFSSHRPPTPPIYDCNNLPALCSRLLPPVECVGDVESMGTIEKSSFLFFC